MEKRGGDSGLFLKNYLGTVSAVPRPRAAVHMESRSPYAHSASIDIQNCIKHLTEDDAFNGYKHSYDRKIIENGVKPSCREELMNEYNKQNPVETDANYDDKKKEKKWTLGGFFRRKCRKDADDSSEESGDGRKGFLSRRKSKRDRRKPRPKANGFDVIIPQQKDPVNGIGKTVEDLWGNGDVKSANGPVRYIYRHQNNGLPDVKDTLQVPKTARRDSNLSRNSSGGSGSLEGRKGRKEVLARAEAKRDQMRDESSSDENESHHSSSSLNRLTTDGRRPRGRHSKRSSRDEESLIAQNGDFRVVKSDFEGHRLPHNRWIPRGVYPDSSDHENVKLSLINHSATPSPARSPRVRQKHLMPIPNSYPVNTFPPGIHYPQGRNVPNYNGFYPNPKYIPAKDPQVHISQPLINYRKGNRNSEYIQPGRRSTSEHSTNRRTLMDYEQFLSSCGTNREKSMSYDQDIHRASYFENDPADIMPYPIHPDGRKRDPSPRDPRRHPNPYYDLPQRTQRPYDDGENLSMGSVTNSLPVQHTSYQIVQRSASGNSFYDNPTDAAYNQIRSSSYQHIPSYVSQQSRGNPERLKACVQNGVKTVTANPVIVKGDAGIHQPKQEQSHPLPKLNTSVPNLRYYADQNPRSRNPIHITCNPSPTHESEPPVVVKSQQNSVKESITNASDFWKLKDQENMMNMHLKKGMAKPPLTQVNGKAERSRSGSPKTREKVSEVKTAKVSVQTKPKVEASSSSNLDDALNELETIYNSLRLGDEDLLARAERRDLPTYKGGQTKSVKTDQLVKGRTYDVYPSHEHQRAVPQRRSGVPDKVNDDMAYRRMKAKERTETNSKKFPPHSYLRSSPALSPVMGDSPNNLTPKDEPDVTFDDVVFRNIRHANSTLKIQDPQPPFGIPIGPITPAPNSDYLHATPSERFRPTFTSSKVPDVVKDDLAFRNLRKDNMTANLPVVENQDGQNPNYLIQKKRAVRSLSANLYNLIQKENTGYQQIERNNNILEKDSEKTQSLTDLSEKDGKVALEKRLKELKEEKNAKRAEFFELAKEQRRKRKSKLSWTELAHLNGDFENVPQLDTSTETLTEDKENGKLRVNAEETRTPEAKYRSPIVELSKYPAAAPSSTLYSNPFREPTPGSPLDEAQLDDLLSALEKEAKTASEDLGRQLVELDKTEEKEKRRSIAEKTDDTKYQSLERRKTETETPSEDVGKLTNEIIQITEMIRRESKDRKSSFEVVTDLSQILHEMEEHQTTKPKDTFQEVYEYNIGLTEGGETGSDAVDAPTEDVNEPEESKDIEDEFERLHMEVDDVVVSELIADVTRGSCGSTDESYSPRPFPNEESSKSMGLCCRDGSSPGSSNGEDSTQLTDQGNVSEIKERERLAKMLGTDGEDKLNAQRVRIVPATSDNVNSRKRIECYKENRRKELLERFNSQVEAATLTKPFKATKRKEDLRGGGTAVGRTPENQVPSSDLRRFISRRDQNKTDTQNGEDTQPGVTVRETRASRLRAATRATADCSRKTPDKEKSTSTPSPVSSTSNSLNRREVDKSYKRKSYLNRSHTSEEVYNDVTGDSLTGRRRSVRGSVLDRKIEDTPKLSNGSAGRDAVPKPKVPSPTKTVPTWSKKPNDRSASLTNGLRKQRSVEEKETERVTASSLRRLEDRFQARRASDGKGYASADNSPAKRGVRNSPDDFARRADLLAAATLKMINRLDEMSKNSRRIEQEVTSSVESRKAPDENTAKSSSPLNRRNSRPNAEVTKPFSILKKKVTSEPAPTVTETRKPKPVSILKRKSLSQDESHTNPPVTFSPSVLENDNPKRQGILKKRRSLDENEVLRRRSFCPETGSSEFKPILKNQRRSSLEDLSGRCKSPDYLPQSILKRKSSRDEEVEELSSTGEPQGILKRKTSGQGQQHVKIADSVILAVGEMQIGESIRPILKKKSSSEEHSTPELSIAEPPRPILKKKSSVEVDDEPKKPILKTRKTSAEDSDDGRRSSFAELDHVRPILKRETSRSTGDVVRRVKPNRFGRPLSSSDIDDELNAIFNKRRSLEFQFTSAMREWDLRRTKSVSLNERVRADALRRPSSVAERVNTLESFLQMERERGSFSPPSPKTPPERFVSATDCFSTPSASKQAPSDEEVKTAKSQHTSSEEEEDAICSCSAPGPSPPAGEVKSATSIFNNETYRSADSDALSNDDSEYLSAVESCSRRMSGLDVKNSEPEIMEDAKEVSEEIFLLQKSGSVRAKASLFQELEKRFKNQPEDDKPKPKAGNRGINRYREKKLLESNSQKYHTQPISTQDVEEAIRNAKKPEDGENFEDELSSMSLTDRVRLFNERIRRESNASPPPPGPAPVRKRGPRFRTQPVTTEEVETAQGQRISPLAASLMRPPDPDLFGLAALSAQSMKEKIYDHANAVSRESTRRGILKSGKAASSESDSSSDSEIRSILKEETTPKDGLKGILKLTPSKPGGTSSSEESSDDGRGEKGANLASILQRVEPVGTEKERKLPKNEAVARRRQIALNKIRNNSSLVKSQSHSAVSGICRGGAKPGRVNGESDGVKCGSGGDAGLKRSTTQPLADGDDDMSGASIQERLARLRKSGELDWQKRKTVAASSDELSVITAGNYLFNETCMLRSQRAVSPQSPKDGDDPRSSILADRLDKLDAAKEGWRKRVQPSDAVQFSVEGKMQSKADGPRRSPLLQVGAERKKRCPKPVTFRSRKNQPALNSVPSSPMEVIGNPIARSVSAPGSGQDGLFSLAATEGPVVSVPKTDDETFTSFFNGLCSDVLLEERLDLKDEDLDVVSRMQSSQLLVQKRNVKIQRRRATLKNPLKTLAARNDLQEYTEIKTGIAEKELKRLKVEKASKNSSLAIEALAGLASSEDFTAVNLKKASDGGVNSPAPPFKSLMLLQVKGRRHVQTRLVEPVAGSINAGDCFVLVTPKKVFQYVGEYANVIEKSRSAEICLHIQQNSDLGCAASSVITIGGGGRATSEQVKEFWRLLGEERRHERPAGHPDEDEIFESAIIDTNMIYEVVNDELVPVHAFWGAIPKIEVLDSNKVLVFDFGSEFYVWIGKNVNIPNRKVALKLARELWEEGYDYTECDVCPLALDAYFDNADDVPESKKAGPARPPWALFAKITENMETVLFREKFLDWPDYSRVIRRSKKDEESDGLDGSGVIEAKPCDARAMLENVRSEPDLVLEGSHLGRGIRYYEEETRRCAEVTTRDVTVWHISEYEYSELPEDAVGQFHMEDSYVVRWHYMITITGRELSGQPSKHLTVGRDRYAYFCWQGRDSPINDKGAAACLTVELDKEHGPQVRVIQGFEPPAFLNLFRGGMVVHAGRRDSDCVEKWRMFICRGDDDAEASLVEVATSMRQLRSAASFVVVNNERGVIIVWHGLKSPDHVRKMAVNAAKRIQEKSPREFDFKTSDLKVREEEEGEESSEFKRAVGGEKRQLYYSLLENKSGAVQTPRMFHLSSVSGEFLFTEVVAPTYNKDVVSPYPFLQEDLYSAPQPALFMIDTGHCLWLWQGWWEGESGEGDRGSGILRFQAERRAAMTTAISYWGLKYGDWTPKAYLVWAGLEPLVFTNLFPMWTDRDHIAEINMKEGRKPGEAVPVKTELASLTQSTYPLAQLQSRPLPDGVNPSFLEDYLEPQCFQTLFGMTVEEFHNLPSWKKKKLKQDAGLF